MSHQMNLRDRELWRGSPYQDTRVPWQKPGLGIYTSRSTEEWNESRSHAAREYHAAHAADNPWWMELALRAAHALFVFTVIVALVCGAVTVCKIGAAFVSGRAQQIVHSIEKGGR